MKNKKIKNYLVLSSVGIVALSSMSFFISSNYDKNNLNSNINNDNLINNFEEYYLNEETFLNQIKRRIDDNKNISSITELDWILNPNFKVIFDNFKTFGNNDNQKINENIDSIVKWDYEVYSRGGNSKTKEGILLNEFNKINEKLNYLEKTYNLQNDNLVNNLNNDLENRKIQIDSTKFPYNSNAFYYGDQEELQKWVKVKYDLRDVSNNLSNKNLEILNYSSDFNENFKIIDLDNLYNQTLYLDYEWKTKNFRDIFSSRNSDRKLKYFNNLLKFNIDFKIMDFMFMNPDNSNALVTIDSPDWYPGENFYTNVSNKNLYTSLLIFNKYLVDKNIEPIYERENLYNNFNDLNFKNWVNSLSDSHFKISKNYGSSGYGDIYEDNIQLLWKTNNQTNHDALENPFSIKNVEKLKILNSEIFFLKNYSAPGWASYKYKNFRLLTNTENSEYINRYKLHLNLKLNVNNKILTPENNQSLERVRAFSFKKINYKNFFVINGEKTSKSLNDGAVWVGNSDDERPKFSIGLNIPLINALNNKKELINFYLKMKENFVSQNSFANNNEYKMVFENKYNNYLKTYNKYLNNGMNGKYSKKELNLIIKFFKNIKNEPIIFNAGQIYSIWNSKNNLKLKIENNGDLISFPVFNKNNNAKWFEILNTNGFNILKFNLTTNEENGLSIFQIPKIEKIINNINKLNDWNYEYDFILPTLFNNNIYIKAKNTRNNFETIKIFDKDLKKFLPVYINSPNVLTGDNNKLVNTFSFLEIENLLIENSNNVLGREYRNEDIETINGINYLKISANKIYENSLNYATKSIGQTTKVKKVLKEQVEESFLEDSAIKLINNKILYNVNFSPLALNLELNKNKMISKKELISQNGAKNKNSLFSSFIYIPNKAHPINEQWLASEYVEIGKNIGDPNYGKYIKIMGATLASPLEREDVEALTFDPNDIDKVYKNLTIINKDVTDRLPLVSIAIQGMLKPEFWNDKLNWNKQITENDINIQSKNDPDYWLQKAIIRERLSINDLLPNDFEGYFWVRASFNDAINQSKLKLKDGYVFLRTKRDENGRFLAHEYLVRIQTNKVAVKKNKSFLEEVKKFKSKKQLKFKNSNLAKEKLIELINDNNLEGIFNYLTYGEFNLPVKIKGISVVDKIKIRQGIEIVDNGLNFRNELIEEILIPWIKKEDRIFELETQLENFSYQNWQEIVVENADLDNLDFHPKNVFDVIKENYWRGYLSLDEFEIIDNFFMDVINLKITKDEYTNLIKKMKNNPEIKIQFKEWTLPAWKPKEKSKWYQKIRLMGYKPFKPGEKLPWDFWNRIENEEEKQINVSENNNNNNNVIKVPLSGGLNNINQDFSFDLDSNPNGYVEIQFDNEYQSFADQNQILKLDIKKVIDEEKLKPGWLFINSTNKLYIPLEQFVELDYLLEKPTLLNGNEFIDKKTECFWKYWKTK